MSAWWLCPGTTYLISQLRMLSDLAPALTSGGCWGFNGPIPPPLWMSVVCVFNCEGIVQYLIKKCKTCHSMYPIDIIATCRLHRDIGEAA